jgi:hypothetical protein
MPSVDTVSYIVNNAYRLNNISNPPIIVSRLRMKICLLSETEELMTSVVITRKAKAAMVAVSHLLIACTVSHDTSARAAPGMAITASMKRDMDRRCFIVVHLK